MSLARVIAETCDTAAAAAAEIRLVLEDRCPDLPPGGEAWWEQARLLAGAVAVCWAEAAAPQAGAAAVARDAAGIEAALAQALGQEEAQQPHGNH